MLSKIKKKKGNKGFTLVELVIVVAILAILVGLLAPQYTKYVEKSRKAADASNMDEMVKAVKIFAADPANNLPAGGYVITIADGKGQQTTGVTATANDAGTTPSSEAIEEAEKAITASIPNWKSTTTKSKKWADGVSASISATVKVNEDGGTSVTYKPEKDFENYMKNGTEETITSNASGGGQGGDNSDSGNGSGSGDATK